MPPWMPPSERPAYTYEQAVNDVKRAATDALRIVQELGVDADLLVNNVFMELLIAKQNEDV